MMKKERVMPNKADAVYNPVEGKWEKRIRSERDIGHAYSELGSLPSPQIPNMDDFAKNKPRVHDHPEVGDDGRHRREVRPPANRQPMRPVKTPAANRPVTPGPAGRSQSGPISRPYRENEPPRKAAPGMVRGIVILLIFLLYILRYLL